MLISRTLEFPARVGGSSFIPVLCFTLWFYFTARQELIHKIPTRIRKPTKYILIGCIPLVTIFNAIGAFIGISYSESEWSYLFEK